MTPERMYMTYKAVEILNTPESRKAYAETDAVSHEGQRTNLYINFLVRNIYKQRLIPAADLGHMGHGGELYRLLEEMIEPLSEADL